MIDIEILMKLNILPIENTSKYHPPMITPISNPTNLFLQSLTPLSFILTIAIASTPKLTTKNTPKQTSKSILIPIPS